MGIRSTVKNLLKKSLLCCTCLLSIGGCTTSPKKENPPEYLYKIITAEEWEKSEGQKSVLLSSPMDTPFIHLATEEQLRHVEEKYWSGKQDYVVIKVKSRKLQGNLVLEKNPHGSNLYYHLYEGSIPMSSVAEHWER